MTVWLARRRAAAVPAVSAEAVLAALSDALLVVDAEDVVREANPAAEALFNLAAETLRGRPLGDRVRFDSPLLAAAARAREILATVAQNDAVVTLGPGRTLPVEVIASPIAERPGWVVLALRDRAFARRLDQHRSVTEAGRTVATVAAALAHEIKNPLSGIRGAAQLIEESAAEGDRELARLITRETDRVCRLVEEMDAFADDGPIVREPVNVHEVLDHVRRLAESGFARHVRFHERYDPSLPPVPGERDRLVQVFLNLVKNAAEAVPAQGGEIVLATAFERAGPVAGGALAVSVRDNGPGIPPHLRERVFEPFVSAKRGGGGLGLALVAKLVGDHGGVVEIESEPRRTLFRVLLPLAGEGRR